MVGDRCLGYIYVYIFSFAVRLLRCRLFYVIGGYTYTYTDTADALYSRRSSDISGTFGRAAPLKG